MSGEWKQGEVGDCMPVTLGSTPVRGGQLATGPRTCSLFCLWCPAQCWQAAKCAAERNRDRPRASLFRRLRCPGCDSSVKCSPHLPLRTHFHRGPGAWQLKQRTFLLLLAPPGQPGPGHEAGQVQQGWPLCRSHDQGERRWQAAEGRDPCKSLALEHSPCRELLLSSLSDLNSQRWQLWLQICFFNWVFVTPLMVIYTSNKHS